MLTTQAVPRTPISAHKVRRTEGETGRSAQPNKKKKQPTPLRPLNSNLYICSEQQGLPLCTRAVPNLGGESETSKVRLGAPPRQWTRARRREKEKRRPKPCVAAVRGDKQVPSHSRLSLAAGARAGNQGRSLNAAAGPRLLLPLLPLLLLTPSP